MYDIVGKRRWAFAFSAVLIALSVVAMVASQVRYGQPLRIGIDFTGGSIFMVPFEEEVTEDLIREVLNERGFEGAIVQALGSPEENRWQVRTREVTAGEVGDLLDLLEAEVGAIDRGEASFDTVEPAVGAEVARAAGLAVLAAAVAVAMFMWFSFRHIPKAGRYGVVTVVGLAHNVVISFGFYALMGIVAGWEVDALFLTAILTVIGFSVEDKIVVFDRIRENIPKHPTESYETIANRSILEVIHRSVATQLTVLFVLVAIIAFGGVTLRPFMSVLLIGVFTETYSAVLVGVPLLVVWERATQRRATAKR